ncbi:hypothetical protein F0U62_01485 [Cystobacter fuscus]|uniref:hypothetical protein n=1 Tax=Cystobacter fuscus TaxID=43 RepID=UPI002B2BF885|nr:hypothetical protein F0U62_01485 [Cystobacter fuscus]
MAAISPWEESGAKKTIRISRAIVTIERDADGFYRPASEEALIALVKKAYAEGKQLRVRGSAHSVAAAIYADPLVTGDGAADPASAPASDAIHVLLNNYRGLRVVDAGQRLVEVEAGVNLGVDPEDPSRTSTLENSLLFNLWRLGWTLSDLGGITHQTVSGFFSTGSSGGSLSWSVYDDIQSLRMIDGRGEVYEVDRDRTPEDFQATVTSMGLLGIISKVVLRCVPTFNITGQEAITRVEDASVDLFGEGSVERPSLARFLERTEYARLEWFPQRKGERLAVWQAQRIEPEPGFRPVRYQEFSGHPELSQVFVCLFFTLLGNLDDLRAARSKLEPIFEQVDEELIQRLACLGRVGQPLVEALTLALEGALDAAIEVLTLAAPLLRKELPNLMGMALDTFMPLDSRKKGQDKGEPQCFRDWSWRGLPMDNQVIGALLPTTFTELWIPLSYTQRAMKLLKDYFDEPASAREALRRTGTYAIELYGAPPNPAWMSMSYSDGKDVWRDGVLRIDFYWFQRNAGDPAEVFYPQFWKLFRDNGIPFRLHWGKGQPVGSQEALADWAAFFRGQYARWDDFLERRRKLDPNNIFLTRYWRQRFDLSHLPAPQPREDVGTPLIMIVPAPSVAERNEVRCRGPSKPLEPPTRSSQGRDVAAWVRFYGWLTLATVLYGLAVAHVPFLLGTPWTTCEVGGGSLGCVLAFHLLEVPMVTFNAFVAGYGLLCFSSRTASRFQSLLRFAVSVNLVFFAFEIALLLDGLRRDEPSWETLALFSVALVLGGGAFLGMFVHEMLRSRAS